jgi:hypothetical protein
MRNATLAVALFAVAMFVGACKSSHEEGVKSDYKSQWTLVNGNTKVATDAAKAVLEGESLKDIGGESTSLDGKAWGKKADGTKIAVAIKRETDTTSQVSVSVGTLGDPALGAELAKKIKIKVDGMK